MNLKALIDSLERFGIFLPSVVAGISDPDLRWKPVSGNWSIVEIVCHLRDEEVDDFRARTRMALEAYPQPWPSIDPEGSARERRYNEQDFEGALKSFTAKRSKSVEWLRSLENPVWTNAFDHPSAGTIQAGDFLASWTAHDHLHLRQIAKRLFEMNQRDAKPFQTRYAGDWSA